IVNDNSPELRDKVVLDVNWLTSHIFGIALAPANFPRSLRSDRASGMVEKRELQNTFPECPLEQLIELFVRFEVCLPYDEHYLICDNYLFPSHLEQDRTNLDDVWPRFDDGLCVVGRIVECTNKMDSLPGSFFPKFQIRLLRRFGHMSPVWYGGIKIADDAVEILATLSSSLKSCEFLRMGPKGCEERCYASMKFIESLRDGLLDEVAGGVEFIHKALSIKMLHHKKFEGYSLKEVDELLHEVGPDASVVLEKCGIREMAVEVMYCGIRRYVHPLDHISHLTMRERKS
ncbi:Unconventional myosin-XVI, partial [Desmophyllum pertusum]